MTFNTKGLMSSIHQDWRTPKELYEHLNEEFNFDFDPCPFNADFDGLEIDWGKDLYVNFIINNVEWKKKLDAQNVKNINSSQNSILEKIEKEVIIHNVKNVNQLEFQEYPKKKDIEEKLNLKDINYYAMDMQDAQNVKLSSHLIKIIFLFSLNVPLDLTRIVNPVEQNMLKKLWHGREKILKQEIKLKLQKINIENLILEERVIEKEILSVITDIEELFLNGQLQNGKDVSYILGTSVPIVDQRHFLLKIILSLYQMIIVQEQSQQILFHRVLDVIHLNMTSILKNGANQKLYKLLKNISEVSLKLKSTTSCFVNPPYKQIKEWIKKGFEESLKGKTVVFLIPSRTDTAYWHDYVMKASEIRFIRGRLKFEGYGGGSAPFPSAIVIFKNG